MGVEHGEAGAYEGSLEVGEEGCLAAGDGVVCGLEEAGEGRGGGVDGVDVVPDGGGAHAPKGRDDPWEEEAVAGSGSCGVFGGFLRGSGGDDRLWV